MSPVKVKYTAIRNNVYHLQIVTHDKKVFRKSLLTSDHVEAARLIDLLIPLISRIKAGEEVTHEINAIITPHDNKPLTVDTGRYLSLSKTWEDYKVYQQGKEKPWTHATAIANERMFEVLFTIYGQDKNVHEITKQDMRSVMEIIKNLPKRVVQPYRSMTTAQLIKCEDVPVDELLGVEAIHKHLKLYKSVFGLYLTDTIDVLDKNPTAGLKAPQSKETYGVYTDTEMKKFVAYARAHKEFKWLKWGLLLLAYTGARRSEIATLTTVNIKFDEDTKRHYLMIAEEGNGKNENATRKVVIHPHLIEWGFLDYVKSRIGLLFPEIAGRNMNRFTKSVVDVRDELNIPHMDEYKKRRVIHSFRHSVITTASGYATNISHVQQVVGHSKTGLGETQRYIHNLPLKMVSYVIDGLDWSK